jgi:hypothetical protein
MIGKNFASGWKLVGIWQKTDSEGQELKKRESERSVAVVTEEVWMADVACGVEMKRLGRARGWMGIEGGEVERVRSASFPRLSWPAPTGRYTIDQSRMARPNACAESFDHCSRIESKSRRNSFCPAFSTGRHMADMAAMSTDRNWLHCLLKLNSCQCLPTATELTPPLLYVLLRTE